MVVRSLPRPLDGTDPAAVPLSACPVWARQRTYFEEQGPEAWASGAVPHQVTCNPDMARSLVEVVTAFATDRAHAIGARSRPLRPLYVIELGAGAGRLGFHAIRALRAAVELRAMGWQPIYVMTDLAEATVAWWQAHPWLAPLARAGLLDFARYDAASDDAIALRVSGHRLAVDAPADELVVIANYVFDSLPHDVFEATDGALREWLVADDELARAPGADVGWAPRGWTSTPITTPRYADPIHAAILADYRGQRGCFAIPIGALTALDRLRALTRGPLLLLSADKGAVTLADALDRDLPTVVEHGSVSMSVNYHAIGAWALAHGGTWMHADHHARAVEVCAFVLGSGAAADHPTTVLAFERAVARRGPDDLHALKRVLVEHASAMTLAELLAYLRLAGHDPRIFLACASAIRIACRHADRASRADLRRALARVWAAYLPIGEDADLAFEIGRLYAELDEPAAALVMLDASRVLHGDRPETLALAERTRRCLADRPALEALW